MKTKVQIRKKIRIMIKRIQVNKQSYSFITVTKYVKFSKECVNALDRHKLMVKISQKTKLKIKSQ